jgi:hypothetical protein
MNKPWWGYELPEIPCQMCDTQGKILPLLAENIIEKNELWRINRLEPCPVCHGEGKVRPIVEVPAGSSYQLWDTTFGGIPISPVFAAPEELAHWLTEHKVYAFGIFRLPYEQWLEFILEKNDTLSTLITSHLDEYPDRWDAFTINFIEELFAFREDSAVAS